MVKEITAAKNEAERLKLRVCPVFVSQVAVRLDIHPAA